MTTKQDRYCQRKRADGYKQITLLLPGSAVLELDRSASKQKSTRLELVKGWLHPDGLPKQNRRLTPPRKVAMLPGQQPET